MGPSPRTMGRTTSSTLLVGNPLGADDCALWLALPTLRTGAMAGAGYHRRVELRLAPQLKPDTPAVETYELQGPWPLRSCKRDS